MRATWQDIPPFWGLKKVHPFPNEYTLAKMIKSYREMFFPMAFVAGVTLDSYTQENYFSVLSFQTLTGIRDFQI